MARDGQWNLCEEFCKAFNIHYENCVEYVGDVFLKSQKTTQALLAYNKARVCNTCYCYFKRLFSIIIYISSVDSTSENCTEVSYE